MGSSNDQPEQNPNKRGPTVGPLGWFLFVVGFSVFIAAMGPSAHFAEVLRTFLFFGATMMALDAILKREKLSLGHFTKWDVSAALVALGLLASFVA